MKKTVLTQGAYHIVQLKVSRCVKRREKKGEGVAEDLEGIQEYKEPTTVSISVTLGMRKKYFCIKKSRLS